MFSFSSFRDQLINFCRSRRWKGSNFSSNFTTIIFFLSCSARLFLASLRSIYCYFFSIKFRKKINTSSLLTLKLNGCSLISVKVLSQQRVPCFYFSSACTHPKDHYISPPLSNQSYVCHKENLYWLWILGSSMSCSVTLIISICVVFSKDKDDCFLFFLFLCVPY